MTTPDQTIKRYIGSLTELFEVLFSIEQTARESGKPHIIDELFVIKGDESRLDPEALLEYTYPDIFQNDERWEEISNLSAIGPHPEKIAWFQHYSILLDALYRPSHDGLSDFWIIVAYYTWRRMRQPDQTPDQQ